MRLGLVGHQLRERAAEPDRLGREVDAAAVTLVEDQVHDGQHCLEPIGKQVVGRDTERDSGGLDLALCAHEPLGHRRFRGQERVGDLVGRQTAESAQRQGDLRFG